MSHVFVSYVREDQKSVDRLRRELKEAGVAVWLDRENIPPGLRWKAAIRQAIDQGAFFLAVFSSHSGRRGKTYMNEELVLAVEQLRQRPTDRAWFVPVVLQGGQVPDRDIGGGETLRDLQWVSLYPDWNRGKSKLLAAITDRGCREASDVDSKFLFLRFVAELFQGPTGSNVLWAFDLFSQEVLASTDDRSSLTVLADSSRELDAVQDCYEKTVDSLRRMWPTIVAMQKRQLIGYIERSGLAGDFEGLLFLAPEEEQMLAIPWGAADAKYALVKQKVQGRCRELGFDLQTHELTAAGASEPVFSKILTTLAELVESRFEADLAAVLEGTNGNPSRSHLSKLRGRVKRAHGELSESLRVSMVDFTLEHSGVEKTSRNEWKAGEAVEERLLPLSKALERILERIDAVDGW